MRANLHVIRATRGFLSLSAVFLAVYCVAGYSVMLRAANPDGKSPDKIEEESSAGAIKRGRNLYVRSCAHCHGDDAHGSGSEEDGPDLFRLRISNARIAAVIRTGIPEEMPSFAKKHSAQDIADLTAYLRSLR